MIIGVDPDSKDTSWAVIQGTTVLAVGVFKTKGRAVAQVIRQLVPAVESVVQAWLPSLVVVEGQKHRQGGKAPPDDIIRLAQIAGAIAGQVMAMCDARVMIPDPEEWKGQTPKPIDQTRSFAHFGILSALATQYAYPTGCKVIARVQGAAQLNKGDWKHVGDALGLARYGSRKLV